MAAEWRRGGAGMGAGGIFARQAEKAREVAAKTAATNLLFC